MMLYFGVARFRRETIPKPTPGLPTFVLWSVIIPQKHHRPGADLPGLRLSALDLRYFVVAFLAAGFFGAALEVPVFLVPVFFLTGCAALYSASLPPIRVKASAALNGYSWTDV